MIAISNSKSGFHSRWQSYCEENNIPYKLVDCYSNDLIEQLRDCKALMWHHSHSEPKDLLIAKQILFALEHTGFKVFPNFNTSWHFDDKLAQKYLLECIKAPLVPSHIFYQKNDALNWIKRTEFPKVFKLRGGAGSSNVKLVKSQNEANDLVQKAFTRGFKNYDAWTNLKERWRRWKNGKTTLFDVLKGFVRIIYPPKYAKISGRELGYVYFQDFLPNNLSDTRIIVIDKKAFALKRFVRKNDFRASGSGDFAYEKEMFDERCIKISIDVTAKLNAQCLAFDFIFDEKNVPLIVEISYGFTASGYDNCPGYWDSDLDWHEGKFNPQGWMVEMMR